MTSEEIKAKLMELFGDARLEFTAAQVNDYPGILYDEYGAPVANSNFGEIVISISYKRSNSHG